MKMSGKNHIFEMCNSAEPKTARQAQQLSCLIQLLYDISLLIRWPDPPLRLEFLQDLYNEYSFQLNWEIQMLEMRLALSPAENAQLTEPVPPFDNVQIIKFVGEHKAQIKKRFFLNRFLKLGTLSEEQATRLDFLRSLKSALPDSLIEGTDRYIYREAEPTGIWRRGLEGVLALNPAVVHYYNQLQDMSDESYSRLRSPFHSRNR